MRMGPPRSFTQAIEAHTTSGTSAEPDSTPAPMLMTMRGPASNRWMLMLHGNGFVADIQQTSSRGGDKLFSTNWVMPMAQRALGPGQLTLRTMLSLEPATITGRQYPLLFQQGETAYGLPIADGQHPHDFVMELAALYDLRLGEKTLLSFYAAPVGDPAIGPTAYPHRESALENPVGTLGHHQEDSTHISDDVVTVGLTRDWLRLEASGFHGREPNEHRWQVQQGSIDSWSARLTFQPGRDWSGQYSYGRLHSPEALFPTEDQDRATASVMLTGPSARKTPVVHPALAIGPPLLPGAARATYPIILSRTAFCSSPLCVSTGAITRLRAWRTLPAPTNCFSASSRCRPIFTKLVRAASGLTRLAMTVISGACRTLPLRWEAKSPFTLRERS